MLPILTTAVGCGHTRRRGVGGISSTYLKEKDPMHLPWTAAMFTGAVYSVAWYKVLLSFELPRFLLPNVQMAEGEGH